MKVEIVSKETIKPSSPTPNHLKIYKVSILDQLAPSIYSSLVLIYPNANDDDRYDQVSQTLKNSLSDTLTLFPPLAGKIKDNVSVDCNDDGVLCYETRVHSTLDQLLLADQDIEYLKHLIVVGDDVNADMGAQLLVQINLFNCGGVALGVSFSRKLCDAATFATFLKSWSAKAINSGQLTAPDLTVTTICPPREDASIIRPVIAPRANDLTIFRLVFDGPKVAALKAKSASESTPHPTRVEAVTALICKCGIAASSKTNKTSDPMPYMIVHAINIRNKLTPTLPENTFGNAFGAYLLYPQQSDTSLDILVDKLRKGRMEYCDSLAMNPEKTINDYIEMYERASTLMEQGESIQAYSFSSWCRCGLYEADFGMGKPILVGVPILNYKNLTILIDTKDGNGIEAYVALDKQDMSLFRANPLLLRYASINPAA